MRSCQPNTGDHIFTRTKVSTTNNIHTVIVGEDALGGSKNDFMLNYLESFQI